MDKLFLPLLNSQIAIIPTYDSFLIRIYFNTKDENYYIAITGSSSFKDTLMNISNNIELYFQNKITQKGNEMYLFGFSESQTVFTLKHKPYTAIVFYQSIECKTEYEINDDLLHMWITKIHNYVQGF